MAMTSPGADAQANGKRACLVSRGESWLRLMSVFALLLVCFVLGDVYSANYDEKGKQPAVDVTDLAGVDESLFLDDDLPDDDELE